MLELKKINLFNDRSPNDVVFCRIVDFLSIENTILFVNFAGSRYNKQTKPPISGSKYTNLTIKNLEDLNIDFIQKNMFRVDMVVFLIDEWPYDHILAEVMSIAIRLDKTSLIDIPTSFNKKMAQDLGYALYSLEKKNKVRGNLVTVKDILKEDPDNNYKIIDEINGESYSFSDYKKSLIRDRKIDDIMD